MIKSINYEKLFLRMDLLARPEFIFSPLQLLKFIYREVLQKKTRLINVMLPWGLVITVKSDDAIGENIARFGLYDLTVSETIWRLSGIGETVLDIGANIGHMSSIMAAKVGVEGKVFSFEPHPEIFQELVHNIDHWRACRVGTLYPQNLALSDEIGKANLTLPKEFKRNRGTGFLSDKTSKANNDIQISVELNKLDCIFSANEKIGLVKIDVEGHELQVLKGAEKLIINKSIRDIIFEEHDAVPSAVTRYLADNGYTLFYISRSLRGPVLLDVTKPFETRPHEAPSYLATLEPERALTRFSRKGWSVLRG